MAFLQIENVSSGYGEVQILWDVSLQLERGKLTALVGSNGVGKTTLLRTLVGLLKPWKGKVTFDGRDVTRMSPHVKADEGLILVPEGRQLFTQMSVHENLEMGAFNRRAKAHFAENLERAYETFPRLKERAAQKAGTLSGGEQQMLAIGRALMASPNVLLLDEPSLGLAPLIIRDIFDVIDRLRAAGNTILIVEQNAFQTLKIADYAYVLELGRVSMQGPASELIHDEGLVEAYLGGQRA